MSSYVPKHDIFHSSFVLYLDLFNTCSKCISTLIGIVNDTSNLKNKLLEILNIILNIRHFVINLIKKKVVFYYNITDLDTIKTWVVKHVVKFETTNTYTIVNDTSLISYQETSNLQDILSVVPNKRGYIHMFDTKIGYVINNEYITLYHYNNAILQSALKDILSFLIKKNGDVEEEKYHPKIYKHKCNNTDINKQSYSWELENTLYENVKLFINPSDKSRLLTPFKDFYNNRELYNKIGLCYKLVSCFIGNPGLGKTTTVKYIAQKYSKNIYMFSSLDMPTEAFLELYRKIPNDSIILFDDFDKVNSYSQSLVTTILNILDGVLTKHGSVIIFCLNKQEILEKRFPTITRVGRIDNYMDFNTFTESVTIEVIEDIYFTASTEDKKYYISILSKRTNPITVSELKNICLRSSGKIENAIKFEEDLIKNNEKNNVK